MKLVELVTREAIVERLEASDKKGALQELVDTIRATRKPPGYKTQDVLAAVLRREKMGSTGIGGGVAIPHAKVEGLTGVIGAFGRSREGVEYGAVDGERVDLFFMILSPAQDANAHVTALRRVSAGLRLPNMPKFLRAAKSAREIWDLLVEMDDAMGE